MLALAQISWSPKGYVPGDGVEEVLARAQFFLDNGMYSMYISTYLNGLPIQIVVGGFAHMYIFCMYVCMYVLFV